MKMFKGVTFSTGLAVLAGCSPTPSGQVAGDGLSTPSLKISGDTSLHLSVIEDQETGCEYIAVSWKDPAITPRLNADGSPKCGGRR